MAFSLHANKLRRAFITLSFCGHTCGLAIILIKWNGWMEVNGGMTCKPELPLLFSSHDDLRHSVSPGSCHPLWHRSHRRKSHIWHRRSHGLCDRPWRILCIHLPHPPSYKCDSGTYSIKKISISQVHLCNNHIISTIYLEYFYSLHTFISTHSEIL